METIHDIQVPTTEAFRQDPPTVSVDSAKSPAENARNFDQTRTVPAHFHNDIDSDKISYDDLKNKPAAVSPNFYVTLTLENTLPQTNANFLGPKFIAPVACQVVSIREIHYQGGTSPVLNVQKNGPGGSDLLASNFDLSGGGGLLLTGTLHATLAHLQFAVGDYVNWGVTGTLTNLMGVCVTIEFEPL